MKKYKVEILQTDTYIIDVLAKNGTEAEKKALRKWNEAYKNGMTHYYQMDDTEIRTDTVYDVTDTDDPFDA